ncbi:chemotaxis regulator CheZ [Pseudovibrio axinellae]|uniref:Chemotaxis regulator CheZ n=1 Tax=Pseudovibrio axinellae TaxID=989403 RepID=A0A166APL9_9HYPH|nr:protein phosphatase CheZ [Pseudovibrio axinellae]KZL21390.1 chemotaxis regulator CheZ [Pseudovibrio axinellae]SEQ98424.1 Chemotaxis regulator CheZ, phosphatase of CheY~P [Pseudovibrio axinellae]
MACSNRKVLLSPEEFDAIKGALSETERGRAFLHDHLTLNRSVETADLLDAVRRLEKTLVDRELPSEMESYRLHTYEMYEAIERTKDEVSKIRLENADNNRFSVASDELDAIVTSTESATQSILESSEAIQDLTDKLRASGSDDAACDAIEEMAMEILMACSFQDLTGQRINKVVKALHYLEDRINKMIRIWGVDLTEDGHPKAEETDQHTKNDRHTDLRPDAHLLNGPQMDGEGVDQADIDALFDTAPVSSEHELIENVVQFSADTTDQEAHQELKEEPEAKAFQAEELNDKAEDLAALEVSQSAQAQDKNLDIASKDASQAGSSAQKTPDVNPVKIEGQSPPLTTPSGNNSDPLHHLSTGERFALFS